MKYLDLLRSLPGATNFPDTLGKDQTKPTKPPEREAKNSPRCQAGNRQNRQNPVSSVLSVPGVAHSEKIEAGDRPLAFASPILSATVPAFAEYPLEVAPLVREYRDTFRRVGYLSGPELKAASDRILELGKRIRRLDPGFDWPALWGEEGALPPGDPAATWETATLNRIEWLSTLDVEGLKAFRLPSGRWVANPSAYVGALRRDVARGPGNPHAGQVAADLRGLAIALTGPEAAPAHPCKAEPFTFHGGAREWDPETEGLIAWLAIAPVPAERFQLDPWRVVSDPAAFVAGLKAAIAQGPDGPRARTGSLQDDLRCYRGAMERGGRWW